MRKFILSLMASLLSCSAASAFWPEATDSSLEIGVGYRNDSIKWKREFCNANPYDCDCSNNSRSKDSCKSDWKNLNIWLIEARGSYVTCDCIYLRGSADYGWITSGKFKNDDNSGFSYFGGGYDNFFSSDRDRKHIRGNVYDAKIAVGYQFKWCDEALSVAPLIGYSWQGHELRNGKHDDGSYSSYDYSDSYSYNCDCDCDDACTYSDYSSGSSSGHNKHRMTDRWNGFFIGFDLGYRFCCDWNFFLDYEYHWANFHAKEHGHRHNRFLDNDYSSSCGCVRHPKSHIHSNDATGNVLDFGVEWDLCDCWIVGLRAEFQWWTAHHAHERSKIFEDSGRCSSEIEGYHKRKIKDVHWDSGSIILDFGMVF